MTKALYRAEINDILPYVPGKPIEEVKREYGIDHIDKLASNENPLGPSPLAIAAIQKCLHQINIYPEAGSLALRTKLAQALDLEADNIVIGNGGEQILSLIARTFVNPGDEAIMGELTFGIYASTVTIMGGKPVKVPMKEHKFDFQAFIDNVNSKTKLIYVCNPNNPTGHVMTAQEVDYLVNSVPEDVVIVFDEAYYDYAKANAQYPDSLKILKQRPNTVILRTFSKALGLAGIRVGYALTSREIAAQMMKVKAVFNVSALAQAAALAALDDHEHLTNTVKLNYQSLALMQEYFEQKNLEYIPTGSNFIFVNVGLSSKMVFEELMKKGIIIRPGYLWGYDNWLRVSSGTIEQTKRFINALDEVLAQAK